MNKVEDYKPDGSGTVIINILDFEGNLVKQIYKNLSEITVSEDNTKNTDSQNQ